MKCRVYGSSVLSPFVSSFIQRRMLKVWSVFGKSPSSLLQKMILWTYYWMNTKVNRIWGICLSLSLRGKKMSSSKLKHGCFTMKLCLSSKWFCFAISFALNLFWLQIHKRMENVGNTEHFCCFSTLRKFPVEFSTCSLISSFDIGV